MSFKHRPWGWALLLLAMGAAATLVLHQATVTAQQQRDVARIQRFVTRTELAIQNRVGRYEDILRGAKGMVLEAKPEVTAEAWRTYVEHLDLAKRHAGLTSLAYIVPVPKADLQDYLLRHAQLTGRYHRPRMDPRPLRDPGLDPDHLMIELCEPAEQSPGALGLDVGASYTQRSAAERARATGRPTLSGLLYFTNGQVRQPAVTLWVPIFRQEPAQDSALNHGKEFQGWVSAGILLPPLMEDVLRGEDVEIAFEVVDALADPESPRLYRSPDWPAGIPAANLRTLDLPGRGWNLGYAPKPGFFRTEGRHLPDWVLFGGLGMSLCLAAVAWSLVGTRARALALAHDMTASLHEAIQRNRSHLENTPLAVIETDASFRIRDWNPAAEVTFGYPREEVLGKDPRFLIPEERQEEVDQRRSVLTTGGSSGMRLTLPAVANTGQRLLCDWYITGLQDDEGGFAGAIFLADDITERKRTEDALRQTQKLESLGVLAGGIAHDFNNLLTAIMGNADVAMGLSPADSRLRDCIQRIESATQRGSDLARQLLAYAGKGHFAVKAQDLNRIIQEMGELLTVSISKKVALCYDLQPGLPPVEADSAQFQQVAMNLVINASEAIGDQTGTVTLRTRAARYTQAQLSSEFPGQVLEPGLYVRMEVADDGCGMDAETIGRIFDPFFTTKFTGRGLGLSAMLGIVRGHRAGIRVESSTGLGTTFTLLFPASEARVPAEPDQPLSSEPLKGLVLVVDDEGIIRDLARSALESAGFTVLEAKDGREAVELFRARKERIDFVFLDMTMPRMGGAEAFRLIRGMDPSVKVMLTSGYTQRESLESLADLPPDGFLQKPFRVRDLVAKVRELMTQKRPD